VAVRHDALNGVATSSAVVAGYAFQNSTTKRRLVPGETKLIGRRLIMDNTSDEEDVEVRAIVEPLAQRVRCTREPGSDLVIYK
jgi:hypothetical protein